MNICYCLNALRGLTFLLDCILYLTQLYYICAIQAFYQALHIVYLRSNLLRKYLLLYGLVLSGWK